MELKSNFQRSNFVSTLLLLVFIILENPTSNTEAWTVLPSNQRSDGLLSCAGINKLARNPSLILATKYSPTLLQDKLQYPRSSVTTCNSKRESQENQSTRSKFSLPDIHSSNILSMSIKVVGKTTSILVAGTFFIVLAYKRDAFMVSFFIGSILNGILSKILKKIINQTRPSDLATSTDVYDKPSDGGMPSSHGASLGFIGTFACIHLPYLTGPLILYSIVSLYYRVQVKLHTWKQVVVGVIVGSTNGAIWYKLCTTGSTVLTTIVSNSSNISTTSTTNVIDLVTKFCLNENGLLPMHLLIIPILIGGATVGSVERRISSWMKKNR